MLASLAFRRYPTYRRHGFAQKAIGEDAELRHDVARKQTREALHYLTHGAASMAIKDAIEPIEREAAKERLTPRWEREKIGKFSLSF